MDEKKFEMMMHYFLFLQRKHKINCAKKRTFWVRLIFQNGKRVGEYNQLFKGLRLGDGEYFFR